MTFYMTKKIFLKEKALTQVAIHLCQSNSFKEVAFNLEKPIYGSFLYEAPFPKPTYFVSDPETLSIWDKVKDDKRLCEAFQESREWDYGQHTHLSQWHAAVDEQCLSLTEGLPLPNSLKQELRPWMKRIALECLTYCRRQELLCEVSRYILMDILTAGDYKLDGRIDEEKVARRLLEDERITISQKYSFACFYFLEVHIKQLWNRLTRKAKLFFRRNCEGKPNGHSLVRLWSRFMNGYIVEQELWTKAISEAIRYGNRLAVMACWKRLQKPMQQQIVIDSALHSLDQWGKSKNYGRVEEELVSPLVPGSPKNIEHVILPSYYSELTVFFLSQMDQEQILAFFTEVFKRSSYHEWKSVTEFLLAWPHQDCFLPTINQLWGIIPKHEYNQCLMVLTQKYSRIDDRENCDYDYQSLLEALWEETPENYKNFVLSTTTGPLYLVNETGTLLSELMKKSPFQYKDQMLFKHIFRDQPQEKRREMMFGDSTEGEFICSQLIKNKEWTFLNWLLKECMAEEEIANFKKQIISSFYCTRLCVNLFEEDREEFVEDVFNWCLASDAEKAKFKHNFIRRDDSSYTCATLLLKGKFAAVERMINFSSSSAKEKKHFKLRFSLKACSYLLEDYAEDYWLEDDVWKQLDGIIAWSVHKEKNVGKFKMDLISRTGVKTHYKIVSVPRRQKKAKRFYQWFDLLPEEIKQLKLDTLFTTEALINIDRVLHSGNGLLLPLLQYCLTDEEMMDHFKAKLNCLFGKNSSENKFLRILLESVQKKLQDETNGKDVFIKDEEGNR